MFPCNALLTISFALALIASNHSLGAADPVFIPWSGDYYGPDGPWQAARMTIQQNPWSTFSSVHVFDLIPGTANYEGVGISHFLLNDTFCEATESGNDLCGKSGTWKRPDRKGSINTAFARTRVINPITNEESMGTVYKSTIGTTGALKVNKTFACILDSDWITSPAGLRYRPQTGTLIIDAYSQADATVRGNLSGSDGHLYSARRILEDLWYEGNIASISFGMHYGSASLNFNGSLIFGGYDKGRVIGKSAQVVNDSVHLLDISLGVEAGASPFYQSFTLKSGLLSNPVSSKIDSLMPGLYLPAAACSALASYLPVTFDSSTGYYLWDVDDPAYARLMTSPAYMAFTFPSTTGPSDNVTIKAALRLFNLTLDTPIVENPTPYFPCFSISPSDKAYLGRAFLQAAFIGRNFHPNVSWLAQAPGPGREKTGLGVTIKELSNSDADIESSEASSDAWMRSWEDYLTPLPELGTTEYPDTSNASSMGETSTKDMSTGDMTEGPMSTGEIAGVITSTVFLVVVVIGGFVCMTLTRKSSQRQLCDHDCPGETHVLGCPHFAHPYVVEMDDLRPRTRLA